MSATLTRIRSSPAPESMLAPLIEVKRERLRERIEGEVQVRRRRLHGIDRVVARRAGQSQHVEAARAAVERDAGAADAGIAELRAGPDGGAGAGDLERAGAQAVGVKLNWSSPAVPVTVRGFPPAFRLTTSMPMRVTVAP